MSAAKKLAICALVVGLLWRFCHAASLADPASEAQPSPDSSSMPTDFDGIGQTSPPPDRGGFLEWLESILRPTTPRPLTTTPSTPQRECPPCTCGRTNTVRRIVGGQETEVLRYPWMALLLYNGNFFCGGSLIDDLYVLTAAHCVRWVSQTSIVVRLLEHDRSNSSVHVIERRVAAILAHERYNALNNDNDLALLRLSAPVELCGRLRPVCQPPPGQDFAGELALVTGWGALSEGGNTSDTLQEVEVPVLSQAQCRSSSYGTSSITDNMLCAGFTDGQKDSCQGDSGGPLHVRVADETREHRLAGIVSWGHGCARPNTPGVYTRVNRYLDWITARTHDACKCDSGQGAAEAGEEAGCGEPGTTEEPGTSHGSEELTTEEPGTGHGSEEPTTEEPGTGHGEVGTAPGSEEHTKNVPLLRRRNWLATGV